MANKKEVRQLQAILENAGFKFVRSENHEIWRSPKYGIFVIPSAHGTSDPRWIKNSLATLRRILNDQPGYRVGPRLQPESPSSYRGKAKR